MSILISTLIIDNLLYAFLFGGAFSRQLDSLWGILFFVIIAVVSYAAGLYLLFRFITPIYRKIKMHSSYFNWIYKTLSVTQYSTGVILGVITFQMLSSSHYYAGLLVTDIAISCTVSAIIMAILGHRFISWYMYSRKEVTVLLYGLTFVVTAIGIGIIVTVDGSFLLSQAPTALIKGSRPLSKVNSSSYISVAPSALILYQITYTPFRLAFLLYWIATALLLRNYSIKFGKVRFWTIVSLPLISFLVGSILVNPDYKHGLLYDALLTLSALSAGGILFGITFLTTARTIRHTSSTEQNSTLTITLLSLHTAPSLLLYLLHRLLSLCHILHLQLLRGHL